MRSASGDEDIESRRRVIINVDREIKGVRDSTLASAYQPGRIGTDRKAYYLCTEE
jgi:hypothetical protein